MPNGHGGYARYFHPALMLLVLLYLVFRHLRYGTTWPLAAATPLAVLVAERFAFHRHMWNASEYGGAYTSQERMAAARARYRRAALIYGAVMLAGVAVLWLR